MPITTPDRPPATTLSAAPVKVAGRDEVADAVAARVAFIAVVGTITAELARLETDAATLEATAAAEEARLEAEAATEEAMALADDTRDAATEETAPAAEERADATREGMLW
jgi:hypothetical protein